MQTSGSSKKMNGMTGPGERITLLADKLKAFMASHIYPNERRFSRVLKGSGICSCRRRK